MSKLYSMIEDALTKKGLAIPSDAFTFKEDNIPDEENLTNTIDMIDGIFSKDELKVLDDPIPRDFPKEEHKDLNDTGALSGKALEFYDTVLQDESFLKDIAQALYPKYLNEEDTKSRIKNLEYQLKKEKDLQKELDDLAKIVNDEPSLLNNIPSELKNAEFDKLSDKDKIKKVKEYYQEKENLTKEKIESIKSIITTNKNAQRNAFKLLQKKFIMWYCELVPMYGSKLASYVLSLPLSELVDLYYKNPNGIEQFVISKYGADKIYDYKLSDIHTISSKDPSIVSIQANADFVRNVLANNNIDKGFVNGAFKFDDEQGHVPGYYTIAGVPVDSKDHLDFVCLSKWNGEADNAIHKASNTYLCVPTNMVKKQLLNQTPIFLNGMPSTINNKGKYVQLTDEQVEKVLLQCMYDYYQGRRSDLVFSEDLIKVFRNNPGAGIILEALKKFVDGIEIMRNTNHGKITYYVLVPYINSNGKLDNGGNTELRRYNRMTGQ